VTPRDALNEIKWRYSRELEGVEIWYVHRGAPNDTKIITGKDVKEIGRGALETVSGTIPYHRIKRIIFNGEVFFDREHERNKRSKRGDT
jgi:uncharacterized protein (UPF0248 family)